MESTSIFNAVKGHRYIPGLSGMAAAWRRMSPSARMPRILWVRRRRLLGWYVAFVVTLILLGLALRLGIGSRWNVVVIVVLTSNLVFMYALDRDRQSLLREVRAAGYRKCPTCGYLLAGLPDAGACPECGYRYEMGALREEWMRWEGRTSGRDRKVNQTLTRHD